MRNEVVTDHLVLYHKPNKKISEGLPDFSNNTPIKIPSIFGSLGAKL